MSAAKAWLQRLLQRLLDTVDSRQLPELLLGDKIPCASHPPAMAHDGPIVPQDTVSEPQNADLLTCGAPLCRIHTVRSECAMLGRTLSQRAPGLESAQPAHQREKRRNKQAAHCSELQQRIRSFALPGCVVSCWPPEVAPECVVLPNEREASPRDQKSAAPSEQPH